jgi:AraC-like DNA-binding protein
VLAGAVAAIDQVPSRLLTDQAGPPTGVCDARRRLVAGGGQERIGGLAAETGWSRRYLERQFRDKLGVSVKEAARVLRFERTRGCDRSAPDAKHRQARRRVRLLRPDPHGE